MSSCRSTFRNTGLAATLAFLSQVQGCTSLQKTAENNPAAVCGAGSLMTGALIFVGCHYLTGKDAACIVGAVTSAVADGLSCWWILKQKLIDDYADTQKKLQYDESQGYVLKILDFSATPKIVKAGDEVKIRAQYALMSPNPTEEIKFERRITFPGNNKPRSEIITYQPGTWGIDDFPFKIDAKTPTGKIELVLELILIDKGKQDRRTLCFNVVKDGVAPTPAELCPTEIKTADEPEKQPPEKAQETKQQPSKVKSHRRKP